MKQALDGDLRPGQTSIESWVRAAASRVSNSETPHLDARVIAKHALGLDDAALILEAKRELTAEEAAKLDALITRRASGEPVAYIVGEKEFRGLTFKMAPGVLVPRPDSETLIEAVARRRPKSAPLRILDLGTGTGCLLLALLDAFPEASGVGVDIDGRATALATRNAAALGFSGRAAFVRGDWGAGVCGLYDLIISNPPYIPSRARATLAIDVREHESAFALFAGEDGLDAYRTILRQVPPLAAAGGLIVLEIGDGLGEAVAALVRAAFPRALIEIDADLGGRGRAMTVETPPRQKNI